MTGETQLFSAGARCAVGEPVFVPAAADAPEGEGFLLSCLFNEVTGTSHLAVFDAFRLENGPLARAPPAAPRPDGLPRRLEARGDACELIARRRRAASSLAARVCCAQVPPLRGEAGEEDQ